MLGKKDSSWSGRLIATAMAAGSAYLASAWLDSELSSHRFNDVKLVGQVLTTESPAWQVQGVMAHFGFSVLMTAAYARYFYPRFPGPGPLKGAAFLQLENALLYPLALPLEKFHAGMKAGEVPSLFTWKSYWGQVVRHIVFGAVLGMLWRPRK